MFPYTKKSAFVLLIVMTGLGCTQSPPSAVPRPNISTEEDRKVEKGGEADAIVFPESETPSEERGLQLLRYLLAEAKVKATVHEFRITRGKEYKGQASYVTGDRCFAVSYQAELEFLAPCRIEEDWSLLWHPEATVDGDFGGRETPREVHLFKKGDRKTVKGILHWHVRQGKWEQVSRPNRIGSMQIEE
jgi:hypothetical protein